jgi:serine/alanine adding enzyme
MKVVRQLDESLWRELVDNHLQAQIFHTPEMFEVFSRAEGHQPTLWAAIDNSRRPLALLLPVRVMLQGGLPRRFTTRAIVYGSVLCGSDPEHREALGLLLNTYRREIKGSVVFTELRNLSDLSELQPVLNESGFAYEDHLDFLIDLNQPREAIWCKISKKTRQRVRGAQKKGVIIEEVIDQQGVANAYKLMQKTYARVHVPLANSTLFEEAFDVLTPRHMLKIFTARVGERLIGAQFRLLHKGKILAWYAGYDHSQSSYSPNEALVWHILQWGMEHGFHLFDFGGAGRPDEEYGPRRFKAKFGGDLVNYGRNVCIHAPLVFRVSKAVYQMSRRVLYR